MGANSWVHVVIFRLPKTVRIRRVVFGTCQPVFSEIQNCAEGHPLFAIPDADLTDDALTAQSFAGYMLNETICGVNFTWTAGTPLPARSMPTNGCATAACGCLRPSA